MKTVNLKKRLEALEVLAGASQIVLPPLNIAFVSGNVRPCQADDSEACPYIGDTGLNLLPCGDSCEEVKNGANEKFN